MYTVILQLHASLQAVSATNLMHMHGVLECNIPLNTLQVILETTFPANRLIGVMRYKGRSINKLQNGIIVLIFKT